MGYSIYSVIFLDGVRLVGSKFQNIFVANAGISLSYYQLKSQQTGKKSIPF